MKSFRSFLAEAKQPPVVFTFGRFNPITKGHGEAIDFVVNLAKRKGGTGMILTSQTNDPKRNPLDFKTKVKFLRKWFPRAVIIDDTSLKTAFQVMDFLATKGHKDVTFVVGADRETKFRKEMTPYVKKDWHFDSFAVVSSGGRSEGVSGTDMRNHVKNDNFKEFEKNLPLSATKRDAKSMFNAVKRGMNL